MPAEGAEDRGGKRSAIVFIFILLITQDNFLLKGGGAEGGVKGDR